MKIKGTSGMTIAQLQDEIAEGGKFVQYPYCFSLILVTYRQSSRICFIRSTENAFSKSWPYLLVTLLLGWWGIPWGIFYSVGCLCTNLGGGRDITEEVMKTLHRETNGFVFDFEKRPELAY